ncbi:hypothetical protein B0H12DRAFT_1138814 [Mycena haematopus]|nr:hypothetical protein B0H12DRAFT_1138814 [Mycena haematopus]
MMATAPVSDQQQFQFHHSSPLDTLVRKTSARRAGPSPHHAAREERRWPQGLSAERPAYQGLPKLSTERQAFQSFNRQSTATWGTNDNNSYIDLEDSNDAVQGLAYGDYDVSSPETDHPTSPALRDSWQSNSDQTIRPDVDVETEGGQWAPIPTVMVSSEHMGYTAHAGKTPIIRPTTANFSRPARSAVEVPQAWENEQKQRVLERNASRRTAAQSRPDSSTSSLYSQTSASAPSQPKRVDFAPSVHSPASASPSGNFTRTAQEYLQLGIQHHEADRLGESAVCFERAATLDGGCGVGMLMWGLALRHGWGCTKNEKQGFKWLRRAAEHAVSDLESVRKGSAVDDGAVQTELVLAIYEVGQCFFHGWGIPKDQKMGVSYYAVAARMGDADAQMDLGFCLANGKGIKKDRKEAAKWYRAAVAQGQSDIGLAWIYKEKLQ